MTDAFVDWFLERIARTFREMTHDGREDVVRAREVEYRLLLEIGETFVPQAHPCAEPGCGNWTILGDSKWCAESLAALEERRRKLAAADGL